MFLGIGNHLGLFNITFLGVNHALGLAAFDELAKKRLPLTENDFLEVLYKAYLRKNPAIQTLTKNDELLHIRQKILNLRGYLKLYRNSEMQGMT